MCEVYCANTGFVLNIIVFAVMMSLLLFRSKVFSRFPYNISFLIITLAFLTQEAFGRAGGGSSGGCKSWLCIILYPIILLYFGYVNFRIWSKNKKIKAALIEMAQREPQWTEEKLLSIARTKFQILQTAWGDQDLDTIKKHLHPTYYANWESQIAEQKSRGEKNPMKGLSINKVTIVDVKNYINDEMDEFTVCFDAQAEDQTIKDNQVVKSDNSKFREFWTFEWEKNDWSLREVTQSSGWSRFVSASIIYEKANKV